MKNLIYTFAAVILVTFAACDKKTIETGKVYSEEEVRDALKFVGQGVSPQNGGPLKIINGKTDVQVTVRWTVATKKSGCKKGIGLCKPTIVKLEDIYYFEPNTIYLPFESVDFDNWEIKLAEIPLIDMTNVRFTIDEDVYVEDEETGTVYAKVQANAYEYDATVGSAGGFRLTSESLLGK